VQDTALRQRRLFPHGSAQQLRQCLGRRGKRSIQALDVEQHCRFFQRHAPQPMALRIEQGR